MKVVVIHNRYRSSAPSGEDRVVDTETDALRRAGHVVVPFERRSDDIAGWSVGQKAVLAVSVAWSREAATSLSSVLAAERPDVAHVHNTFPLLTPSVLRACAAASVPVVATLHNYKLSCARGEFFRDGAVCHACSGHVGLPAIVNSCYRGSAVMTAPVVAATAIGRRIWQEVPSAYVFVSAAQRELLRSLKLPEDRCFVKWNLVPDRPARTDPPENIVVYAGRLDEAKGIPLLMRAWDIFRSTPHPEITLEIAGGGPLEEVVRAWAAEREDVRVVGLLDRSEVAQLLRRARAAILPSAWEETFGLVAIEAMASGVPVVAAGHGSLAELVRDGVDGVHFNPGDAGDLARVLFDVADRATRWAKLGLGARRSYQERFGPAANLEQLLDVYRFVGRNPR